MMEKRSAHLYHKHQRAEKDMLNREQRKRLAERLHDDVMSDHVGEIYPVDDEAQEVGARHCSKHRVGESVRALDRWKADVGEGWAQSGSAGK